MQVVEMKNHNFFVECSKEMHENMKVKMIFLMLRCKVNLEKMMSYSHAN